MTFDDFKEGFVAVLSQAIEQLSSSEDEEQPSDSVTGVCFTFSFSPFKIFLSHLSHSFNY